MSKEQLVIDGRLHDVHYQRNANGRNPFYTGSATPALDSALGIQHTAKADALPRDAMGVVRKAEDAAPALPGLKL